MKYAYLFTVSLFLLIVKLNAQVSNDEVLFTIDDDKVLVSDFLRVYNKNLDLIKDESKNDIDEYLTLFTNFKLKIKEAEALKLHEKKTYIQELESYKIQLAKGYLSDSKITKELLQEAYHNISHDVKANHILVKVSENASPEDSLTAYKKILKLRERTLTEGFDKVRKEVHNGKTTYGEELGYFSGFRMVYKFEKVAFNTPIGEISQPFRTRFGYHIVNVLDKRKSLGERTVAHIMIDNKNNDSIAKDKIQNIYKQITEGEAFDDLAKEFSQDKASAGRGGELSPITRGQIASIKFENIAFTLKNVGDVSEPFKTKFGWHIVKLLDKKPIASFEDLKEELTRKIKRDSRSKLIDDALIEKLKNQYNVESDFSDLDYFVSILTPDYFDRTWKLPADFKADKLFLKIEENQFTYQDFGDYLERTQRKIKSEMPLKEVTELKFNAFLNSKLIEYKQDHLEFENQEFANILNEYREGLLLFDIMSNNIWNTSEKDSIALREFYNANKSNYLNPKSINALVATTSKEKALKKVSKWLHKGKSIEDIKKCINKKDDKLVVFISDTVSVDSKVLPKSMNVKKGISPLYKHNDNYVLVDIKEIFPGTQKSYDDARSQVISDYQEEKEKKWLENLSSKYKIVVNDVVFTRLKSQIKG